MELLLEYFWTLYHRLRRKKYQFVYFVKAHWYKSCYQPDSVWDDTFVGKCRNCKNNKKNTNNPETPCQKCSEYWR